MKQYLALARVSSREQEREGFSLAVQEDALRGYAEKNGGRVVQLYRIAETASKSDERKSFRELIAYAKKHAAELDGVLFYKLDRAARNLFDYVELERLESEYQLPFISISQPTENTPAGRMMRRSLANIASFYTEQQSQDVREGHTRRVQEGWFVSKAPYGYRNTRVNGRSITEIDDAAATVVKQIFRLYAYEPLTIDSLRDRLHAEQVEYKPGSPRFSRSKLHHILLDRSYLGEVPFKGEWYPGKHEPLIDRTTWDRVQALLGGHTYHTHEMTFASGFMTCGHCGRVITGERITKNTKNGKRRYVYYRCSRYNTEGHPRVRLPEKELTRQLMAIFDSIRIQDDSVREWFRTVLAAQTRDEQEETRAKRTELQRQSSLLVAQQDRLLNLQLDETIDQATYARKHTELRERLSSIKLQLDVLDRSHDENSELSSKVFELSQTLKEQWIKADYAARRRILEILCLNCTLDGVNLVPTMRKPFDMLVEGLNLENNQRDRI